MINAGEVWCHDAYYLDDDEFKPKYFLVLAVRPTDCIVYRLLTSRQLNKPKSPACFHGLPYPGFYLGVPGGKELVKETWVDLRECEDMDTVAFAKLFREGLLRRVGKLPVKDFVAALDCAAAADDTTKRQRAAILDSKAAVLS